jgi:hypothetical protein
MKKLCDFLKYHCGFGYKVTIPPGFFDEEVREWLSFTLGKRWCLVRLTQLMFQSAEDQMVFFLRWNDRIDEMKQTHQCRCLICCMQQSLK